MAKKPESDHRIFKLNIKAGDPLAQRLFSLIGGHLERILSLDQLDRIYEDVTGRDDNRSFTDRVMDFFNVSYDLNDTDWERIPKTGPAVVVANHPFGAIEGIILASLLRSVRPDVKIMANYILRRMPEMRDIMIFVDPFATAGAASRNLKPLKESIQWLRGGGMLAVFPAGEVSHIDLRRLQITDPKWNDTVARLVRITESPVVPLYFEGVNSMLFQILGLVHPRLRTAMLPREMLNKTNRTIRIKVGHAIPFEKLRIFESDEELTAYLRLRTYILAYRGARRRRGLRIALPHMPRKWPALAPLVPAEDPDVMAAEIARIPAGQVLVRGKEFLVIAAEPAQIPHVLREIGRLRELTFRAVGEGTGQPLDLDRFDDYYMHLFVWNEQKREVVGAYRIGKTDRILPERGTKGLYTSTLFKFRPKLLERIDPALELGRSFVRPEYQRSYSPLLLLWKAVGQIVIREPRYKVLFGPVSITKEYLSFSRYLIAAFLSVNNFMPDLARHVRARKPLRPRRFGVVDLRLTSRMIRDLDDLAVLLADIESDEKGVPILFKQYLKLGGRMLGFNLDPQFSDVLDGLVMVDLMQTDTRILERYMGREEAQSFLAYHGRSLSRPAPEAA